MEAENKSTDKADQKSSTLSLSGSDETTKWPDHGAWPTTPEIRPETLLRRSLDWYDQKNEELSFEIKAIKARLASMPEGVTPEDTDEKEDADKKSTDSFITPVPKPTPSPRKINVSPATPIPAKRSLFNVKDLQQPEVNWRRPLDEQTNPPWEDPSIPPSLQARMKDLYLQGRKDGSHFGSLAETIAASEKVRGFLNSTTNDIPERIVEEGEGDIPEATATKPTDAENIIKNFPMSDSDSIRSKSEAAKQEALQLENKKKEAKAVYGRQKGLVAKMCNHFLNNADKQDWEVRDYNVRLATHIAKMQSHFMFYLSYVVSDAEEQAARDEFNPRLIKANEVLGLANALAQIEENVAKKQAEADAATTHAQAKTSEDVRTKVTTSAPHPKTTETVSVQPQLSTAGTDYTSLDFSKGAFAASFPTSTTINFNWAVRQL